MLPFHSLDAVTAIGPGEVLDLGSDPVDHFSVQFSVAVVPMTGTWTVGIALQGSLDGVTWFNIAPINVNTDELTGSPTVTSVSQWGTAGNYGGNTVTSPLARFVRANLGSDTNVSSFTADAWILPGQPT